MAKKSCKRIAVGGFLFRHKGENNPTYQEWVHAGCPPNTTVFITLPEAMHSGIPILDAHLVNGVYHRLPPEHWGKPVAVEISPWEGENILAPQPDYTVAGIQPTRPSNAGFSYHGKKEKK